MYSLCVVTRYEPIKSEGNVSHSVKTEILEQSRETKHIGDNVLCPRHAGARGMIT